MYEAAPVPTLTDGFDHRVMFRDRRFHNLLLVHQWNQQDLRTNYGRFATELDLILAIMEAEVE